MDFTTYGRFSANRHGPCHRFVSGGFTTARINFTYGTTHEFSNLKNNTVALDGAVQGPALDPVAKRYSFDHHANCLRLITSATCQQVFAAIYLGGLIIDTETVLLINELDADTLLSVWLCLHPDKINDLRVRELVDRVGLTDAHGPAFEAHWMHRELTVWKKEDQTQTTLEAKLGHLDKYFAGELKEPAARPERPSNGYAWHPLKGWQTIETQRAFADIYDRGFLTGFLAEPQADGSTMYTVAKKSDLVALALGPATEDPKVRDARYTDTVLGALAKLEKEQNPNQADNTNWGGGSSIGGSPRNTDKSSSRLTAEQVLAVFRKYTDR